jgi:hypothetical protein
MRQNKYAVALFYIRSLQEEEDYDIWTILEIVEATSSSQAVIILLDKYLDRIEADYQDYDLVDIQVEEVLGC